MHLTYSLGIFRFVAKEKEKKRENTVIKKLIQKNLRNKPLQSEKIKETDIQNINQTHGPLK